MEGESKAFLQAWSILLASLCYSYFIASKIRKGKLRSLLFLPNFFVFTIFPLMFSSVILRGVLAYFITYLGNFKLLLFSYGIGPLIDSQNTHNLKPKPADQQNCDQPIQLISLYRFIIVAIFPMKIKDSNNQKQKSMKILPPNLLHETLLFSMCSSFCYVFKGQLHLMVVLLNYFCMMYFFLDVIVGMCNKLVRAIMDVELLQPFDEPYLSSSLQDFWSRRWNLMVTEVLRSTVYEPMRAFLSKYLSQQPKVLVLSVMATFVVSGLMHELIFYYLTCVNPTWEITWFFVLNGLCVILEGYIKNRLGQRLRLHWVVSCPLTLGIVMGTGYIWFFPPLLRNQVDIRIAEEGRAMFEFIRSQLFR